MATVKKKNPQTYKLGDKVTILQSGGMQGQIVELRGPLGPDGAYIYRVEVQNVPDPSPIEVREDQLELIVESEQ